MSEQFEMIAKTFQGLEEILAEELTTLGANDVQIGRRMVSFTGDKEMMYKANFCLRTAIRILNAGGGTGNRTSVFTPETDFAAKWHPILSKRPDSLWTPAFFHFFGRAFHKWTRGTGQGKKCGFYSDFEMNIDPVSSRS